MTLSRRGFLSGAAAGLVVAFYVPNMAKAVPKQAVPQLPPANAFLRIGPDDSVTVVIAHSEMGQGIWTGLAMLIAEELECDWTKVRSEHAPASPVYANPLMGFQLTGGSTSTISEFERYRTVGATAKDMLIRAAAAKWKVAPAKCKAANGVITSGSNRATYGSLAEAAMKLPPPTKVSLKDPKNWNIIGKPTKRLDTPEKITGKAQYGMDIQFPGLRTAVVMRAPFGGKVAKVDDSAALKIPGVEKVVSTGTGVAVVAKNYWAAKVGRDALVVSWTKPDMIVDSDRLMVEWREKAKTVGTPAHDVGKVEDALGKAKTKFDAMFEVPYLAHAPMEPLNCAVKIDGDKVEIWAGTQAQGLDQMAAARVAGTSPDKVTLHTPFLGGGFGRRATPTSDFVSEAVLIAKLAGVPCKTVWSREDDIRGGYYRPAYVHRVQVAVDDKGMPTAWDHVVVGQSIAAGTPFEGFMVKNGIDGTSIEGLNDSPYLAKLPAHRVSLHSPRTPIPVLWWRSVGNTHTAFVIESVIDDLAHAAKQDPLAYRLALLDKHPRHAAVLKAAAEKAGWGKPPPAGHARGLAVHECFGSIVAEVAEVSVTGNKIKVHQVTAAVDCGTAVNPLGIEAQLQSCIAFGMSAALHGKLTIKNGEVVESNFHDYPVLRIHEMPKVVVHIMPNDSKARMGGIGEPATAPVAPAIANAIFALTKKRLRKLPFDLGGVS